MSDGGDPVFQLLLHAIELLMSMVDAGDIFGPAVFAEGRVKGCEVVYITTYMPTVRGLRTLRLDGSDIRGGTPAEHALHIYKRVGEVRVIGLSTHSDSTRFYESARGSDSTDHSVAFRREAEQSAYAARRRAAWP